MSFGVIEFLDDYHWLLRLQRPEEEWKSQYACVFTEAYRRGKGGVKLSWADIVTQERPLRRDSGASGLEQGQERLVEVSIDGLHEKPMPWEMGAMMDKFRYLSLESR